MTPFMAWFFVGIGVPWALAILPRKDWQDTSIVLAVGLALGPLLGTLWLFVLGTVASFSLEGALFGTVIIAGIGAWLAWQRRHPQGELAQFEEQSTFQALRYVLWGLIMIALAANVIDTAFWPFLRYDTLWTFGYNARVFMIEGYIPPYIDYYPQLVPLTFTYGQLAWGEVNDHAARAAVPWFILSSTMSAYVLGWRVYGRRIIGLVTAALWLLTPTVLVWSSAGDLEHPMAIYFTLAAVFIVLAWHADDDRQANDIVRYAIIAGLMLGGAMWIKPTAGAFVFGMALVLVGVMLWAWRGNGDRWLWRLSKLWLLTRIGLVAAPIGGLWYIRNIVVGHTWTNLPGAYWQDLAQRSGMQLDAIWLLAMLAIVGAIYVNIGNRQWLRIAALVSAGILMSVAILPTLLSVPDTGWVWQTSWDMVNGFREPHRGLTTAEGVMLIAGFILLAYGGWPAWQQLSVSTRLGFAITWGLGLPFFLVFFWSFSYHYRLMLTVLPIILAPIAALLVAIVLPVMQKNQARRFGLLAVIIILATPAPIAATYHTLINVFAADGVQTTEEKYAYANPALMTTVEVLANYAEAHGDLRLLAPGENRLSFFFPTWDIDDETLPTDIADLDGYDVFVYGVVDLLWRTYDLYPNQVQAWTQLAWVYPLPPYGQPLANDGPQDLPMPRLLRPIFTPIDDGTFHYELFSIDTEAAFVYIEPTFTTEATQFESRMTLVGYDVPTTVVAGESYLLKFYWQGQTPPADYSIFVHLTPPDDPTQILAQRDGGLMEGLFPTRFLTEGMIFQDRRIITIPADTQAQDAVLRIGVYDPDTGGRFGIEVDGQRSESLTLLPSINIR